MKKPYFSSFSLRLFLCIFFTSFFLLLIGLLAMYHFSVNAATKVDHQMVEQNLTVTAENLENLFSECDKSAQVAFSQTELLASLKSYYSFRSNTYNAIQHALTTAVVSSPSTICMDLCDSWGNVISSTAHYEKALPFSNMEECRRYLDALPEYYMGYSQSWYFLSPNPINVAQYRFLNVREIHLTASNVPSPLLLISLSENRISSIYDFLGENSRIISRSGFIISAADKSLIGTQGDLRIFGDLIRSNRSRSISTACTSEYYAAYLPSIDSFLVVNSHTKFLQSNKLFTAVISAIIAVVGLLLSFLWANYISSFMTRPLLETKACIEQVRNGNLNIRCRILRQDEIGYLGESFNHMMDSLNEQIRKNNEQQKLAKEHALRLLHAQINPHLLYNSLDSALYLMTINDTERSIKILEQLSSFFKLSLQSGSKIITVGKALEHVDSYLKLQNLCRMKNFQLVVTGAEELKQAPIMHMLLQPIVENSVLHGFEGGYTDGRVEISLQHDEPDLIIRITDNGMGIQRQELEELRQILQSPTSSGKSFGLWNVAQRMRMYYGCQYTISIDSEFGEYTSVSLRIPDHYKERTEE